MNTNENEIGHQNLRAIGAIVAKVENEKNNSQGLKMVLAGTVGMFSSLLLAGSNGATLLAGVVQKGQEWGLVSTATPNHEQAVLGLLTVAGAAIMGGFFKVTGKKRVSNYSDEEVAKLVEKKTGVVPQTPEDQAWSKLKAYVKKTAGNEDHLEDWSGVSASTTQAKPKH